MLCVAYRGALREPEGSLILVGVLASLCAEHPQDGYASKQGFHRRKKQKIGVPCIQNNVDGSLQQLFVFF